MRIIPRNDNWDQVFKPIFVGREFVAEFFQRLRIITQHDLTCSSDNPSDGIRTDDQVRIQQPRVNRPFNHNDPQFRDRDLFVFCFNIGDGRFTAHEAMVRHDVRRIRDSTGYSIGDVMYRAAVEDAVAEVTYASPRPGFSATARKRAFITRVTDQVCGVSVYKIEARTAQYARETSQRELKRLLGKITTQEFLHWNGTRKPKAFRDLVDLLWREGVNTEDHCGNGSSGMTAKRS